MSTWRCVGIHVRFLNHFDITVRLKSDILPLRGGNWWVESMAIIRSAVVISKLTSHLLCRFARET